MRVEIGISIRVWIRACVETRARVRVKARVGVGAGVELRDLHDASATFRVRVGVTFRLAPVAG